MSEMKKIKGSDKLIVCFSGLWNQLGGIQPFEFSNFLDQTYPEIDSIFYIDEHKSWYHRGIKGITKNIDETVQYLKAQIKNYNKIIFLGVSAGGYASILFGSLCNVDSVVAFIPQTILMNSANPKYRDLKPHLNSKTKYFLFGNPNAPEKDVHHISHCKRLVEDKNISNVFITEIPDFNMKTIRDSGQLKTILDSLLN